MGTSNRFHAVSCAVLVLLLGGCGGCEPAPVVGISNYAEMDFTRRGHFYSAPFPSDDLLDETGRVRIDAFPNPGDVALVDQAKALLARDARGFATTGGIFFRLVRDEAPPRLPEPWETVREDSPIFLIPIMDDGDRRRHPVEVAYLSDGGPFGTTRMLTMRPVQGLPLRPNTTYAAVVTRFFFKDGEVGPSQAPQLDLLRRAYRPEGLEGLAHGRYVRAMEAVEYLFPNGGRDVAALAVFTTGDPTAELTAALTDAQSRPLPAPAPFTLAEVFDDYCVFESSLSVPVYQSGTPPYSTLGGDWLRDARGVPKLQRTEEAKLVVTLPRQPMPEYGWPTAVFIPTGGGGERPLVDRGQRATNGGQAIAPGTGPALEFARVGFAGVSLDGPHGGLRNVTQGDEQFLMFNILNPAALRDNVRQAALEQALLADVLEELSLDASACPGTSEEARFDRWRFALMGHSMGATIAPLTLAEQPTYRGLILSGAGASYLENVLHKRKPLEVKPLAEMMFNYAPGTLHRHDPVLTLVQWAAEPADPQVYAAKALLPTDHEWPLERFVLMLQGIVDNYIPPRIANSLSLALKLDLVGPSLDVDHPSMPPDQVPLAPLLPLSGGRGLPSPVDYRQSPRVVMQFPSDGIEDGHEVVFQTDAPKVRYRCFLRWVSSESDSERECHRD